MRGGDGPGQIDGKPICIMQYKSIVTRDNLCLSFLGGYFIDEVFQHPPTYRQSLAEAVRLQGNNMQNMFLIGR